MARAARLARRVNVGWWLDGLLPSLLGVSLASAIALLMVRRAELPAWPVALVGAAAGVIAGGVCWWIARRRFYSLRDGLVRLESLHRLHSRLTAAADGVGEWPSIPYELSDGYQWRWRRALIHPLVSLAALASAIWLPIQPASAVAPRTLEEPLAWNQVEEWAETLEEDTFIEEEALSNLREQVQELRDRPMEEWYSHSSLEASDSLKEQTEQAIRELASDLQAARSGLAALERFDSEMPLAMQDSWKSFMDPSLSGLGQGPLPIDPSLLSQLEGIDPSQLRALTQEEWEALKEALENGCKACSACEGDGTNLVLAVSSTWGNGGIDRGPGEAPLFLKEDETKLGATRPETLRNPNYERAALGDTLAVGEVEHDIDESAYQGPQAAGAVADAGKGGETVWKTPLMPDEQEIVKRYFE